MIQKQLTDCWMYIPQWFNTQKQRKNERWKIALVDMSNLEYTAKSVKNISSAEAAFICRVLTRGSRLSVYLFYFILFDYSCLSVWWMPKQENCSTLKSRQNVDEILGIFLREILKMFRGKNNFILDNFERNFNNIS